MRILLTLLLLLIGLVAAPAYATEEPASDEVDMVETFDGAEPAVILEDSGESEPEPAWTFRYLVPTFLAITVLGMGVTGYRWYQLRSKYQVVE